MKTVGKILLFIGALFFFIGGILSIVGLVGGAISDPGLLFSDWAHISAFIIALLWILLDVFAGLYGMIYAVSGKHWTFVTVFSWIILIWFILSVILTLVSSIKNNSWVWSNSWDSVVYGGISGVLYCLGYFLDRKKH
jgi:hypothetical protein